MLKKGKRTASTKVHANPKRQKTSDVTDSEKAIELFSQYVDPSGDSIGPEGVERFCEHLGLDPADRRVLILAWKMNAKKMGYFTAAEFERERDAGLKSLRAFTLDKIKKALKLQDEEFNSSRGGYEFNNFYEFAFKYCLLEARQKIIEVELAIQMLQISMAGHPHCEEFTQFLQQQKDYKTINFDQWQSFGRLAEEVKPDCSNFDEDQAWPLILDQYVEWRQQGNPK